MDHIPEALGLQPAQASTKLAELALDDLGTEVAIRAQSVPLTADLFINAENNRSRKRMILPRNRHQPCPVFGIEIGRIDHRQPSKRQSLSKDKVEKLECLR